MLPLPVSVTSACSISGAPEATSLLTAKVFGAPPHRKSTTACPGRGEEENPRVRRRKEAQREAGRLRWLAPPLLAAVVILSRPYLVGTPVSVAQPVEVSQKGAALFQRACIGCHDGGGNILQPGATLFMRDLQRNDVATEEEIYNITYFGKGRMPGFGEKCTPRGQCTFGARLQEEEIKQLAEFVKSQADRGWPKLEIHAD